MTSEPREKMDNVDNDKPMIGKRKKQRIWLAAIAIVLTAIIACLLWSSWNSESIGQQLAEIEAARAIPDSENAAVIYNELIQAPLPADVNENQYILGKLIEAARFEKCRFPIIPGPEGAPPQLTRLREMKKWANLLHTTAEKDLADGRINDAIRKWQCILQMAEHLRQQPRFTDYLVAIAIEAMPLHGGSVFVIEGEAADAHLNLIETMPVHTEDRWPAVLKEIAPINKVVGRRLRQDLELRYRIEHGFRGLLSNTHEREIERIGEISRRLLTSSRGLHILIALRRYKNKHGRYPQTLDEIESQIPAEALIDPANNGQFVYMLTANSFKLYSTGKNKIDENGKYEPDAGDDWPIWPPYKTKPKPQQPQSQTPDPNANESK